MYVCISKYSHKPSPSIASRVEPVTFCIRMVALKLDCTVADKGVESLIMLEGKWCMAVHKHVHLQGLSWQ